MDAVQHDETKYRAERIRTTGFIDADAFERTNEHLVGHSKFQNGLNIDHVLNCIGNEGASLPGTLDSGASLCIFCKQVSQDHSRVHVFIQNQHVDQSLHNTSNYHEAR